MKTFLSILTAVAVLPLYARAQSPRPNAYDVLGRTLTPLVGVFAEKSKSPNRALVLKARLEQMTGMRPEFAGAAVDLSLQTPDKLLLRGPVLGQTLVICRRGQEIWVHPGAQAKALIDATATQQELPPLDPKYQLAPLRLPIPQKQLVFLPALFQVRDAGDESLDGQVCRVLDLQLMPELSRSVKESAGWAGRLWVRASDHTPARLQLSRGSEWSVTIRIDRLQYLPKLPAETWKPTPEQAADVLKIPPGRYDQLLRAAVGNR